MRVVKSTDKSSRSFGPWPFSVSIDSTLGVAYTTHSDQVSEAPRMGDNLALANAVTTGRWPASAAARAQATAAATLARVS